LKTFKAALKEDIEEAISKEPGVLTLNAVYEKDNPTHVTVFEIFVNQKAHEAHMQTTHFKKYRKITKEMVKSTFRIEVIPIVLVSKPNL
jgi:quinol monooxygenase YgiN